jgi:hypothetical protein
LLVCDEWEKTEKNGEKALNFVLYFLIQPLVIVEYRTIVVVSSYDLYKSLVKQKFRDHPSEFEQYILHYLIWGGGWCHRFVEDVYLVAH